MASFGPTKIDLCVTRADSPLIGPFSITDKGTGAAIDITGFSFLMTVDPAEEPIDALNNLFQISGVIVAPATGGKVTFQPSIANLTQTPAEYFYDIQMTDGGGAPLTIVKGAFEILQDITK